MGRNGERGSPKGNLQKGWELLKREWVAVLAGVVGILLIWRVGLTPLEVVERFDWLSWIGLVGLVVATTGIKESGLLREGVELLIERVKSVRGLGVAVVGTTGGLAPLVTNDVALLITVPLTLLLRPHFPRGVLEKLLILEGIGANLGSGFSPIGNPQNFYIYTNSNLPFWEFLLLPLLPPFLLSAGLLIGVTALLLPPRQLEEHSLPHSTPSKLLGIGGVVGLVGVIGGIESGIPLLLSLPALLLPLLYKKLDWGLIATFGLFILDSDLARELPGVQHLLSTLSPLPEWEAGLLLSQLISNFPATLLLFPSSSDPIGLALGVNLGGNGVLWASLANLIALRPLHSPKIYLTFHLYSIPALLISTGIALLFLR